MYKNTSHTEALFSTTQVAKIMGVSRIAVFRKIKTGRLPAKKIGRNYIVAKTDLEKAVKDYGETFRRLGREE
jgi:excisionase family DNA binding protein